MLVSQHLPDRENREADCLSRDALYSFQQLVLNAHPQPMILPIPLMHGLIHRHPDWTLQEWRARISFYFAHGLAGSSQKTYKSAEKRYLTFCSMQNISSLPLYESVLCKFVTHRAYESLQYRSIKTFLSGLRYFQISADLGDTYQAHMPKLNYVLKDVKRVRAMSGSGARERLPITPTILRKQKVCGL